MLDYKSVCRLKRRALRLYARHGIDVGSGSFSYDPLLYQMECNAHEAAHMLTLGIGILPGAWGQIVSSKIDKMSKVRQDDNEIRTAALVGLALVRLGVLDVEDQYAIIKDCAGNLHSVESSCAKWMLRVEKKYFRRQRCKKLQAMSIELAAWIAGRVKLEHQESK